MRQQCLGYIATLSLCRIQAYYACWQELADSNCTDGAAFNEVRRHRVASLHSKNCSNKKRMQAYCVHSVHCQEPMDQAGLCCRRQFGFSIAANSSHPAFPLVSNTCTAFAHLSSASQKSRADSTSSWNVFSNSLHIRA